MIGFRVDVDEKVGGGHMQRCLALAESLPESETIVFIRGDISPLERTGKKYRRLVIPREISLENESNFIRDAMPESLRACFFDISNAHTYAQADSLKGYLERFKTICTSRVLIDGLASDSVLGRVSDLDVEFVVTPYVGAERAAGRFTHLYGPEYFILPERVLSERVGARVIAEKAEKILVSMGQADPDKLSSFVANEIAVNLVASNPTLRLSVVVGSLFSAFQRDKLEKMARAWGENISLIEGQSDLFPYYAETDFTVTGSGLTKYELAFMGIPNAFLAASPGMCAINELFSKAGSGVNLGELGKLAKGQVADAIKRMIGDYPNRKRMSESGQRLVDGRGISRIFSAVFGDDL